MKRDMQAEEKIINFLLDHAGEKWHLSRISQLTKVSLSSIHQILGRKIKEGLVKKEKLGNLSLYFLDSDDSLVCQLKVTRTVKLLKPLVAKLRKVSQKIILFGSTSVGKDVVDSDIDLFVVSNEKSEVRNIVSQAKLGKRVQLIIKNTLEFHEIKKKDEVFYKEIDKGMILWEERTSG